jgi:hypothetical protein
VASLGETEVRADHSQEESGCAAERIVRAALDPYEEAVALKAMLGRGVTVDGAVQALGQLYPGGVPGEDDAEITDGFTSQVARALATVLRYGRSQAPGTNRVKPGRFSFMRPRVLRPNVRPACPVQRVSAIHCPAATRRPGGIVAGQEAEIGGKLGGP